MLDGVKSLPKSEDLLPLLKSRSTCIIAISYSSQPPETLRKEIDQQLIRGCSSITVQPLSTVHTTQRIVHSIMSRIHFTPLNREQRLLEKIAGLTSGCPGLVKLTKALLQRCLEEAEKSEGDVEVDFLGRFAAKIPLLSERPAPRTRPPSPAITGEVRAMSTRPSFRINSYTSELITAFQLPPTDEFMLRVLSVFTPVPIPLSFIDIVQSLVVKATQGNVGPGRGVPNSISNLLSTMLLRPYPSPVICPPNSQFTHHYRASPDPASKRNKFFFVPQLVQDSLWERMEEADIVFTITTAYKALLEYGHRPELNLYFATGLAEIVVEKCDANRNCIDDNVYKQAYKLLIDLQLKNRRNFSLSSTSDQANAPSSLA